MSNTNDSIIDFHTHYKDITHPDVFTKYHINHILSIPFDLSRLNVKWDDILPIVGMNLKPKWYIKQLLNALPELNKEWYQSFKGHESFVTLVPWINLGMNIDAVKYEDWFTTSKIVKLIPVFDNITHTGDGEAVAFHHKHPTDRIFDAKNAYLPALHRFVGKLPQKVIMIHTGWGSSPVYYNNLIAHYPDKIFVLAHLKEDDDSDNLERQVIMKKYENVYLELSYLSSPKRLKQYIELGFGDRILFGSDYRTDADECTLQWMLDAVKLAPMSEDARRKILYENAHKLLKKIGVNL